MPDESPLTYDETCEYVQDKIIEGLHRGRPIHEILKVAVVQSMPLDDRLEAEIDRAWAEEEKWYNTVPDFEACSRCRTLEHKSTMLCPHCAAGHDGVWDHAVSGFDLDSILRRIEQNAKSHPQSANIYADEDVKALAAEVRRLQRIVNGARRHRDVARHLP